ncbi:amino acid ABC transporter permease [Roseomonas sp. AR75]|jgi:polar amino acid transport system permease protein|uniref:amino acid ABC transporter permease n=1 Tax=Roseomonas sp. AR75 TaxID=2562311 RepID=UPI0010C0261C|nr:amino acid ABC transporter permease [Roseomonas sp. AR75]
MNEFVQAFLNPEIAAAALPILWMGFQQTLLLSLLVVPLGLGAGFGFALLSTRRERWLRWPLVVVIDIFRAIPPLVLLILLYAGLPFAGLDLGAWGAVALAFMLNTGAYYAEILRAGIEAVPAGQREAGRALGLKRWQIWVFIVLPQAVRNVLPDLIGNTLEVVKLTSIASVVALPELLFQARQAQSITFNATPIVVAAVAYFLLLWPCVRLLSRLENRQLAARR